MYRILLVYTSMTGNTEEMAKVISAVIEKNEQFELTKVDMFDDYPENIDAYDGIIIGSYTWGDGDVPEEMLDLLDEIEDYDLTGKIAALFGSGDTGYEYFCEALNQFEGVLKQAGASIPLSNLKVDMEPNDDELLSCQQFAKQFISSCLGADKHIMESV